MPRPKSKKTIRQKIDEEKASRVQESETETQFTIAEPDEQQVFFNRIGIITGKKGNQKVELNFSLKTFDGLLPGSFKPDPKKPAEPTESYKNALQALAQDVIKINELPEEWESSLKVAYVDFTYGKKENADKLIGLNIKACKSLTEAEEAATFETVYKQFEAEKDELVAPNGCYERVQNLIQEAMNFLNGQRAGVVQGTLDLDGSESGDSESEDDDENVD